MKTFKRIVAALLLAAPLGAAANAAVYNYVLDGGITGTFSVDSASRTLTMMSMDLGGKHFDTSNTGILFAGSDAFTLGGLVNGVPILRNNFGGSVDNNDFLVIGIDFTVRPLPDELDAMTSTQGFSVIPIKMTQSIANPPAPAPEPAAWAMLVAGFGVVGGMMRRRKRSVISFA